MSNLELKPCPFCGAGEMVAKKENEDVYHNGWYYKIICRSCYATGGQYPTFERAIEAWNRRVNND